MKFVWPEKWEKGKGHYSPGVISNGLLFISGQLPVDHDTGKIVDGPVSAHAEMAIKNMMEVLAAAGLSINSIVQCRVYIPNVAYWDEVNAVYAKFFGDHKPARAVVPSRELHHGALVEIEAVAELEG